VSIQSLILVPQPYFNEPGYEQRGNMAESKRYNEVRATSVMRLLSDVPSWRSYAVRGALVLSCLYPLWSQRLPGQHAVLLTAMRTSCK
jgi:hypothetical protein